MPFKGQSALLDVDDKADGGGDRRYGSPSGAAGAALAERLDQPGVIVAHVADALADRLGFHAIGIATVAPRGVVTSIRDVAPEAVVGRHLFRS